MYTAIGRVMCLKVYINGVGYSKMLCSSSNTQSKLT